MPEAIATTKRKFYKALDALTQPSRPRTSETIASKDGTAPNTIRTTAQAFDEARERARKRLRLSASSNDTLTSQTTLGRPHIEKLPTPQSDRKPPPNFAPWSQDAFLARLKTFSNVSTWHSKPDSVNEVEWAKRGWQCIATNTVACKGGCEKRVVVDLEASRPVVDNGVDEEAEEAPDTDIADDSVESALVHRYEALIVAGHAEPCLWRKAGCKDDIYRLGVVRPIVWQPELSRRFQSLVPIHTSLSQVKLKTEEANAPEPTKVAAMLSDMPADILDPYECDPETAEKCFEVAMHGWRGTSDSETHLLQCDACFQRVGLWMYQPDYRSAFTDIDDDEQNDGVAVLDLILTHRDYCPWQNAGSQHASGSLAGLNVCQILRRVVTEYVRERRRRTQHVAQDAADPLPNGSEDEELVSRTQSRDEIARQDQERESRIRKLKSLFNFKRRT